MRGALSALACCALLLSACEDEVANVPPTAPSIAPPPAAAAPPVGARPAEKAVVDEQPAPKMDIVEAEFTESERSRDPFRSFADMFKAESKGVAKSQREVVLSQFSIDELKLIGIVTRAEPAKAMLVDPGGMGHVVKRGQFVGKADIVQAAGRTGASYEINWRVDRIRDGDIVLVREDPQNPDVPSATRVIPLRPEGSEDKK
jgi:type IV pilus assembly protein PilP